MSIEITYDSDGNPYMVHQDTSGWSSSEVFDEKRHGWMLDQIDPREFIAIDIGEQTRWLVQKVNDLKRENWQLKQRLKMFTCE